MCGRFNLINPKDIEERFGFVDWHEKRIEPRFNIAPSQELWTIIQPAEGAARVQMATWGLVPWWARAADKGSRRPPPINARAETAANSPMFRDALAASRCLIPATGFYEWQVVPGTRERTPMHIRLKGTLPFAFAGIWLPGKRDAPPTVAIVTTRPNQLMASIHKRMPAILRPEDEHTWLDPSLTDPERLLPLLEPYPSELMEASQVSSLVNSFKNDGPELIEPASGPIQLRAFI